MSPSKGSRDGGGAHYTYAVLPAEPPGPTRRADPSDVHESLRVVRNHVASARALAGDRTLGVERLDAALAILDELLAALGDAERGG